MQGWIKLYRAIQDNEFYFAERFNKALAWIDLILLANHKPSTIFLKGVEINLMRGELAYSQVSLAARWKWNPRTVNKFLGMLQRRQMIQSRKTNITTVITIINYDLYQGSAEQIAERSVEQNPSDIQTNKNDKNEKNVKHLLQEEEIIFDERPFKISMRMLENMKLSYPTIKKFHPEIIRIKDVINEKEANGEHIKNPMAFLHHHLKQLNLSPSDLGAGSFNTRRESPVEFRRDNGGQPQLLGEILKKAFMLPGELPK